jgi:hypothetical protein
MALNPVEKLNVFDEPLRTELRKRSLSKNLVQTRAPFLRFTTAANVNDLVVGDNEQKFDAYRGCQFFTLGVHGYNEINYSADDLYGTQAERGLVVGTTYINGQQKLVRTFGGLEIRESAKNYPPPGVTSAKVERLRNGNVLRFTIETQCYTQEQLEMLDALCYVPGMTCVLEWGTQFSTPTGQKTIDTKLDFTKVGEVKTIIRTSLKLSRTDFIRSWCEPNEYNYDWAVANIANVKTRIENNIYKTTVVAYGRADNIMYISAYATANPINNAILDREKNITKSVTEYFKLNGEFSRFLDNVITSPSILEDAYRKQVVTFRDGVDRKEIKNNLPTSQDTGIINDLGFESVYFITFDFFVRYILNDSRYGLLGIMNSGISDAYKLDVLLSPLTDGADVITVGYNRYLRSTSPETMIIYNPNASLNTTQPSINSSIINQLENRATDTTAKNDVRAIAAETKLSPALSPIWEQPFGVDITAGNESGITLLSRGVWLNSKAIQSAFLNARTVMEGLETLLRNVNAATENYWDLKLYYDDDKQQFRILDDNNRSVDFNTKEKIYEFNKKLASTDGDTIGPDVIDIQIATDYPKLLFSQLAISGINGGNLVNDPQRTDYDFIRKTSVRDVLISDDPLDPTVVSISSSPPQTFPSLSTFTQDLFNTRIRSTLGNSITLDRLSTTLQAGFGESINPKVQSLLRDLFAIPTLLTEGQAQFFRNRLTDLKTNNEITEQQVVSLTTLFAERAKAIVRRLKAFEIDAFTNAYSTWKSAPENQLQFAAPADATRVAATSTDNPIQLITNKVNASRDIFLTLIDGAVRLSEQQQATQREEELRRQAEQISAQTVGVPGRVGAGAAAARGGL